MATQLNTTELDFKKIKDNLKSYLKNSDSSFSDYDFEGSGLNHLLDILAYNTHYNAITAHMAVNESFIDTAQVRANVVSHAKLVGYTPKSVSSASATLSVKLQRTSGTASSATIASGTTFTTSVDGVNYTFQTLADTVSDRYNETTGNFEFDEVVIREGSSKTTKFFFNNLNNEKFVIPDNTIDTSTLKVVVRDSATSLATSTYTLFRVESEVTSESQVYYLQENYDGLYQIEFGNNIFGKRPNADSIIECTYLTGSLDGPNGANSFTYTGSLPTNTTLASSGAITITSNASGGANRESIESIQFNAPRSFVAQNRAVTTDDYVVNVKEAIQDVQDVTVYGGQTLTPPQYGKVFISVKPKSGLYLTEGQKQEILNYLEKKKVVTVTPEVVDADYTFIYFNITSKYNSALTSLTRAQLESGIRSAVLSFNDTFLQQYGNNFRYSKFLKAIDDSNSAISGSVGQIYSYKRVNFLPNETAGKEIDFGFRLLGSVNQEGSFITSTGWGYNNRTYFIDDAPIAGDSEKRTLRRFYINEVNNKVIEDANVGFLYPHTGKIQLNAQLVDSATYIDLTVIPLSYDIPGVANKVLTIDITKSLLVADSNTQTVSTGIVPENYISVPAAATGSSYNPLSSGVFVPHTMYDPATGIAYYASTYELHLEYQSRGYVHYVPSNVATSAPASSTAPVDTYTQTASGPASYGSGTGATGSSQTGGGSAGTGGGGQSQPQNPGGGGSYGGY